VTEEHTINQFSRFVETLWDKANLTLHGYQKLLVNLNSFDKTMELVGDLTLMKPMSSEYAGLMFYLFLGQTGTYTGFNKQKATMYDNWLNNRSYTEVP